MFGRVTPHQKRAMVRALQARGHVVAMTGDGVNDALALKDADIGVAMGNGSPATRAVAQLVLLDGRFAHLPEAVAEGRRVIANIERAANLFLVKNVYSLVLALITVATLSAYPLAPIQLTLISTVTIGVPGFFLALGPNRRRYLPGFLAAGAAVLGAGRAASPAPPPTRATSPSAGSSRARAWPAPGPRRPSSCWSSRCGRWSSSPGRSSAWKLGAGRGHGRRGRRGRAGARRWGTGSCCWWSRRRRSLVAAVVGAAGALLVELAARSGAYRR